MGIRLFLFPCFVFRFAAIFGPVSLVFRFPLFATTTKEIPYIYTNEAVFCRIVVRLRHFLYQVLEYLERRAACANVIQPTVFTKSRKPRFL